MSQCLWIFCRMGNISRCLDFSEGWEACPTVLTSSEELEACPTVLQEVEVGGRAIIMEGVEGVGH